MKMGLRFAKLRDDWASFTDSYDRILNTYNTVFKEEVTREEREIDLDQMR